MLPHSRSILDRAQISSQLATLRWQGWRETMPLAAWGSPAGRAMCGRRLQSPPSPSRLETNVCARVTGLPSPHVLPQALEDTEWRDEPIREGELAWLWRETRR